VLANLLIVLIISLSPVLSAPMYFFLTYLSFIDGCYTCVTTPKMIIDLLYQRRTFSLGGFWLSSSWSTSWEVQKSSSSLSWPMTAMWPFASPCTTWQLCGRGSGVSWWW
jgi:hypothetical protein